MASFWWQFMLTHMPSPCVIQSHCIFRNTASSHGFTGRRLTDKVKHRCSGAWNPQESSRPWAGKINSGRAVCTHFSRDKVSINKHTINGPLGPRSEATWELGFMEEDTVHSALATRQHRIRCSGFASSGDHKEKQPRLAQTPSALFTINASFTGNWAISLQKIKMILMQGQTTAFLIPLY